MSYALSFDISYVTVTKVSRSHSPVFELDIKTLRQSISVECGLDLGQYYLWYLANSKLTEWHVILSHISQQGANREPEIRPLDLKWLLVIRLNTVSTRLDAHLSSASNPMFGPKVVVKYDVTQLEFCLSISPIPLFALDLAGNALCVYARGYSNTNKLNKWAKLIMELAKHNQSHLMKNDIIIKTYIKSDKSVKQETVFHSVR